MAVRLSAEGHFTWPEWVQYLSTEIAADKDKVSDNNLETYYNQWLAALEKLVTDKGLASSGEMTGCKEEWRRAYLNTPHGEAIELSAAERKPD